jgi:hypothetical protein
MARGLLREPTTGWYKNSRSRRKFDRWMGAEEG